MKYLGRLRKQQELATLKMGIQEVGGSTPLAPPKHYPTKLTDAEHGGPEHAVTANGIFAAPIAMLCFYVTRGTGGA